jgi:AcrR family transcriptional regulator
MRDEERSSRHRLRAAAKSLFAERGYEGTSIADITRAARTSHSQFLKYYSGKEELRREILEEHWSELSRSVILAMSGVPSATEKLKLALNMFVTLLDNDREFRAILLLEQATIRNHGEAVVGGKYGEFVATLDDIIQEMRDSGELLAKVDLQAFRAALMGSIEGMMRGQLLARSNFPAHYSIEQMRTTLSMLISSGCDVQRPSIAPQAGLSETVFAPSSDDDWIRYYLKLADRALSPSELS